MVVDDSIDPVKGASTVDWSTYGAVLFDLDGVITPTAEVHDRAWTGLFAPWGFTTDDYLTHVDGKPRYDGVRDFLRSRDVELPFGDPSDDPGDNTICAMGNKKNQLFRTILDRDGVHAYSGSLTLLDHLDRIGLSQAIVSSSKNARSVLSAAGLTDRFSPIVDGVVAAQWQLAGKPAPDMFLRAAELIGVEPESAVVVEDATSGVAAGAAGDFGLVIGVDRGGNREALATHGADLVVDDLIETLPPDERIA